MLISSPEYLMGPLTEEFGVDRTVKAKPVLGPDDVLLLFTHHWARDTCTFPTEDQRQALAAIILLSIYTGCRPAELVDGTKRGAARCDLHGADNSDDADNADEETDPDDDNPDDPDYEGQDPWDNSADADCDDGTGELGTLTRSYKALCYEDIRLWVVQNPTRGQRDLVAMDITFAHHKGADRQPKPYDP
jgi:hypothetical protein